MDCEQALALISAQIDREIEPADRARLEQHLAECPACRATADAFALQDEELRHTFVPRREAAVATAVRIDADRRATLDRGTVFLEVAPQAPEAGGTTFVVRTPDREVKAHGTRFEVRAGGPGTGVVVTQGRVGVTPPASSSEVAVQS